MGWYVGPKADHICSHAKFNLRGCTRRAGHSGSHTNINDPYGRTWEDADGKYCETKEDWVWLIDNLTGSGGKYNDYPKE